VFSGFQTNKNMYIHTYWYWNMHLRRSGENICSRCILNKLLKTKQEKFCCTPSTFSKFIITKISIIKKQSAQSKQVFDKQFWCCKSRIKVDQSLLQTSHNMGPCQQIQKLFFQSAEKLRKTSKWTFKFFIISFTQWLQ